MVRYTFRIENKYNILIDINEKEPIMVRGLYTAFTGMNTQMQKMEVVSNNLANANTTGFKQDNVVLKSFDEVLAIKINDQTAISNRRIGTMSLGVKLENIYSNFEQGALTPTEDPHTLAIEGDGYFTVGRLNEDGSFSEFYTRDGSFVLNQQGEMVTKDGYYFLSDGGPITIPDGQLSITQEGNIYVDNTFVNQLDLTAVEDNRTLKKVGDSLFDPTDRSTKKAFNGAIRHSFIESSNVNSVKEMIEMMNVMRTYEANQKVLTTYDNTLEQVVQGVGRV